MLAVMAGMREPRALVEQVLRRYPMIRDLLRESSTVEMWLEEGEATDEVKGQRERVQMILEGRFGPLEPSEVAELPSAMPPLRRTFVDGQPKVRAGGHMQVALPQSR